MQFNVLYFELTKEPSEQIELISAVNTQKVTVHYHCPMTANIASH